MEAERPGRVEAQRVGGLARRLARRAEPGPGGAGEPAQEGGGPRVELRGLADDDREPVAEDHRGRVHAGVLQGDAEKAAAVGLQDGPGVLE